MVLSGVLFEQTVLTVEGAAAVLQEALAHDAAAQEKWSAGAALGAVTGYRPPLPRPLTPRHKPTPSLAEAAVIMVSIPAR